MCTAVSYRPKSHYFGRNFDLERSYDEKIVITPRNYPLKFRNGKQIPSHYAMIGTAAIANEYPLYFEATNEKGLSIAALNFPDSAIYHPETDSKENITPYELPLWLLGQCNSVIEAATKLNEINLWDKPFSQEYPLSPLHWLICDRQSSYTLESVNTGLKLYDNPIGILTNNPPFPYHMYNLANFMQLTHKPPHNRQPIELKPYSFGMGSFGLPGDMSSGSRFIKAAFTKMHSICGETEENAVNQFFHILNSVLQPKGLTQLPNGDYEFTRYSSCCNTDTCVYYYKTYENPTIHAIDMHQENLDENFLITYPMIDTAMILRQN